MKIRIFCVFFTVIFLFSYYTVLPVSAEDATVATTLTTLYNESVADTYSIATLTDTVIPLEVTTQGNVTIHITYPVLANDYICKVYTDDSYISMIHSCLLSSTTSSFDLSLTAGAAQTFYLYFSSTNKKSEEIYYDFTITATLTKAVTQSTTSKKTLKNNTWTKKKTATAKTKQYYKLVLTNNQYFHINSNNSYINIQLLDQKKKTALSSTIALKSSNNFQSSFALGKGTYYVLVTADRTTSYQIYFQGNKVKNVSGNSFKSSTKMTMGKQYISLIKATSATETGQYYRFKLSSPQKIQIAFYVENSSDRFQLQIYDGNKQPLPTNNYQMGNAGLLYINSRTPIPKDTYYIKITKVKKNSSGCYSLVVRKQS